MNNQTRITVLYCQHCATRDADIPSTINKSEDLSIKTVLLPCSSKVQAGNILSILDRDADGVELVACSEEACRFLVGSKRAENRVNYIHSLLEKIKVSTMRLGLTRKAGLRRDDILKLAQNRASAIKQT